YVNHGFWDTYRTAWPAYALLYPQLAAQLADGFVQQYREGGWIARWSAPGYADCMTGTSSDIAFADLQVKGVALPDPRSAYDSGLRNATVAPTAAERSEEHTSELQSRFDLVCRLLLEKKKDIPLLKS